MSKTEEAKKCIEEAKAAGCVPQLKGEWCQWTPPPPMRLVMRMAAVASEVAEIIRASDSPNEKLTR